MIRVNILLLLTWGCIPGPRRRVEGYKVSMLEGYKSRLVIIYSLHRIKLHYGIPDLTL